MTQDTMRARRAGLQVTAGTYSLTAEEQGALGTATPRMGVPYIHLIAVTLPQEVGQYSSTAARRDASAILFHAAEALHRGAETYQ